MRVRMSVLRMCVVPSLFMVIALATASHGGGIQQPATAGSKAAGRTSGGIQGVISEEGRPVAGAKVVLESFASGQCAKLAEAAKLSEEEKQELKTCSHELPPTKSNSRGEYRFVGVKQGWYKLVIEWNLRERPSSALPVTWQGDYSIAFFESKEEPKKYSALAQGKIFTYSGPQLLRRDFDYKNAAKPLF